MNILADLNPKQKAAVTHGDGPLLIVAGAGTGKTKVITHRIAWLIEQGKAKADEILALTFTEKAAREMQERLFDFELTTIPQHISTFHSFGDELLREYALEAELPPDFQVMGQAEQVIFLDEHLMELPLKALRPHGRPAKYLSGLAGAFSRAKCENKSPEDYAAFVKKETARVKALKDPELKADAQMELTKQQEIAECYAVYERLKAERNKLDYADQVYRPLRLLAGNAVILRRLCEQYKYVLVDEFQDTNVAQHALVTLLAGKNGNLNVVGDDDQSIFSFQGAAISNILGFRKNHPKASEVVLTDNYRSTQQILDGSYRLIKHNADRLEETEGIDKHLKSHAKTGPAVVPILRETVDDEAEWVAEYIAKKAEGKTELAEMAILVRVKSLIDPFTRALARRQIPYLAEGTGRLFDRSEVKLCINWLRAVADPLDSPALGYVATSDAYKLPQDTMIRLAQQMRLRHEPLWDLLAKPDPKTFSPEAAMAAAKLRDDLTRAGAKARDLPVDQLLYGWLEQVGILARLKADEETLAARNLSRFFQRLQQFARTTDDPTVSGWIRYFDDIVALEDESVATETDTDYDAVRILTAHAAKGLEFDVVFVVGLAQAKFPKTFRRDQVNCYPLLEHPPDKDNHLREERRLLYVAMTRARRELFLTAASDYHTKRPWAISEFIAEAIDQSAAGVVPKLRTTPAKRIAQSAPPPPLFAEYNPPERIPLSFTSWNAYQDCPLKYYWDYIIGIREEPDFTLAYGTLIHAVIQQLNQAKLHGHTPKLDEILKWYAEGWRNERFISKAHEAAVFSRGEATLKRFFAEEAKREAPTAVEHPFSFGLAGCTVSGKYDRVDEHKGLTTIVDYKTGDTDQVAADKRVKTDKQLTLYALALFEQTGKLPAQVVFSFVDAGLSAAGTRTERQITKMREAIEQTAADIRAAKFEPNRAQHRCNPFADCPGHRMPHRTSAAF